MCCVSDYLWIVDSKAVKSLHSEALFDSQGFEYLPLPLDGLKAYISSFCFMFLYQISMIRMSTTFWQARVIRFALRASTLSCEDNCLVASLKYFTYLKQWLKNEVVNTHILAHTHTHTYTHTHTHTHKHTHTHTYEHTHTQTFTYNFFGSTPVISIFPDLGLKRRFEWSESASIVGAFKIRKIHHFLLTVDDKNYSKILSLVVQCADTVAGKAASPS